MPLPSRRCHGKSTSLSRSGALIMETAIETAAQRFARPRNAQSMDGAFCPSMGHFLC